MIARLAGTLASKSPESIIVDVHGVGYEVLVSLQSFYRLPDEGAAIQLLTYTHVREDALQLFGFFDVTERQLFLLLLTVAGVGPRLALNILSGLAASDLRAALDAGDVVRLVSIPGVGKKTAERLVLELREKVRSVAVPGPVNGDGRVGIEDEAVSALVNLGYRRVDAEHAVKAACKSGASELEAAIRDALQQLSK